MFQETKVEWGLTPNNNYYLQKTVSTFLNGLTANMKIAFLTLRITAISLPAIHTILHLTTEEGVLFISKIMIKQSLKMSIS